MHTLQHTACVMLTCEIRAASDTGTFSNDTVLDRRAVATHMLLCTMPVVSVYSIANFFEGELKLLKRGENSVSSGHVLSTDYDGTLGILKGKVAASMRDKSYNVQVGDRNIALYSCFLLAI